MTTLLIKNASILVTMDAQRQEIPDAGLFARDGFIEQVGPSSILPQSADQILDLSGHIVFPGLINTHHHFYQNMTRQIPAAQNGNLFTWLKTLYPIWARLTPEHMFISAQTALAELALSGCTTASDHCYLFPNGSRLDDEIAAAKEVGLRLHACRGSMSLGESNGGLPPDSVVDDEQTILQDCQRLIEQYHDSKPGSFLQIIVAPCSPYTVSPELMRQSAELARRYQVNLHTHLAETEDEQAYCLEQFGHRPAAFMEELGWVGRDVWFAHAIYINPDEINLFAHTGCGVAHCASSNMRLASGIAPVIGYRKAGVNVGLGTDGSSSNDSSNLFAEVRQAMLLARLSAALAGASLSTQEGPPLMTARQALELGTIGGAAVLGRKDIGSLEVGKCADFFAIRTQRLDYAGGVHDPVAAAIFCAPQKVDQLVVHGRQVVSDGNLLTIDIPRQVEKHNQAASRLLAS